MYGRSKLPSGYNHWIQFLRPHLGFLFIKQNKVVVWIAMRRISVLTTGIQVLLSTSE